MFQVDYFTLSASDASNQYVTLSYTPDSTSVALDICGGSAQLFRPGNGDFGVSINDGTGQIIWNNPSFNLYSILNTANYDSTNPDKLRVIYDR